MVIAAAHVYHMNFLQAIVIASGRAGISREGVAMVGGLFRGLTRLAAVATSLPAVFFLARSFKTRTLYPFAIYSVLFGTASAIRLGVF